MDNSYNTTQRKIALKQTQKTSILPSKTSKTSKYLSKFTKETHTTPAFVSLKSKKASNQQKLKMSTKSTSKLLPTEKSEAKMDHIMANISLPIKQKNIPMTSPEEKLTHTE
jgi:hypothetical protein